MEDTKTKPIEDKVIGRRMLFYYLGWGIMGIFLSAVAGATIRFFFPRLLYEPPTKYGIGFLSDYTLGVSVKFKKEKRIWIVREVDKLYVIKAKCTHLGCTPSWLASEGKFKCPCHGSGFTPDGVNIEGPAPRPLERLKVVLADDGQIMVDESIRFRGERGEWDRKNAFIST